MRISIEGLYRFQERACGFFAWAFVAYAIFLVATHAAFPDPTPTLEASAFPPGTRTALTLFVLAIGLRRGAGRS